MNKISFDISHCEVCLLAKMRKLSLLSNNHLSDAIVDLIHCDVWGPYHVPTYNGMTFFLTIVDDCSRFTLTYLLKHKSEGSAMLIRFISLVKTQFGTTMKQIRSNNAKELALTDFFLQENGLLHQFSCVQCLEQNSVVEQKHQHLLNVARALYFQSKVPIKYWDECISTATFLINRLPNPIRKHSTPYEQLFGKSLDYSALQTFGCSCYVASLPVGHTKFEPWAIKYVFLGYPIGYKGYKLLNL